MAITGAAGRVAEAVVAVAAVQVDAIGLPLLMLASVQMTLQGLLVLQGRAAPTLETILHDGDETGELCAQHAFTFGFFGLGRSDVLMTFTMDLDVLFLHAGFAVGFTTIEICDSVGHFSTTVGAAESIEILRGIVLDPTRTTLILEGPPTQTLTITIQDGSDIGSL